MVLNSACTGTGKFKKEKPTQCSCKDASLLAGRSTWVDRGQMC